MIKKKDYKTDKEKISEISKKLEDGCHDILTGRRYADFLKVMSKFYHYSFNNSLLIAMQRPDATYLAGYQAWKTKFKRQVKKGERGIKIIAPASVKIKADPERFDHSAVMPVADDKTKAEDQKTIERQFFRVTTIFDIAQTEGEPLPTTGVDELTGSVEGCGKFMAALKKIALVPIRFDEISGGAKGYYNPKNREIVIKQGMSEIQTLKTAVHETAHSVLHDRDHMKETGEMKDRTVKEIEAESVAFIVLNFFHIDTSDYSWGYLAGWDGDTEMKKLRASMETIQKTSESFIDGIKEEILENAGPEVENKQSVIAQLTAGSHSHSKIEAAVKTEVKRSEEAVI